MSIESGFISSVVESPVSREPVLVHESEGGFSQLWRIDKDGRFRILKALKPQFRGQAKYETLLRKEYLIGYGLSHPSIREVYDFRSVDGLGNCIEMEYIDGQRLDEWLSGGCADKKTTEKLALQLCDALTYIHSKQVVHRDIKPANLLVTFNCNNLKIIDFGFSDADSFSILKAPAGTLAFASPELLSGEAVDYRTDIYSAGKVISLLLPRRRAVIKKCTADARERRYASASLIASDLARRDVTLKAVFIYLAAVAVIAVCVYGYSRIHSGGKVPPDRVDAGGIPEAVKSNIETALEDSVSFMLNQQRAQTRGGKDGVKQDSGNRSRASAKGGKEDETVSVNDLDDLFRQATEMVEERY